MLLLRAGPRAPFRRSPCSRAAGVHRGRGRAMARRGGSPRLGLLSSSRQPAWPGFSPKICERYTHDCVVFILWESSYWNVFQKTVFGTCSKKLMATLHDSVKTCTSLTSGIPRLLYLYIYIYIYNIKLKFKKGRNHVLLPVRRSAPRTGRRRARAQSTRRLASGMAPVSNLPFQFLESESFWIGIEEL